MCAWYEIISYHTILTTLILTIAVVGIREDAAASPA